MTRATRRAWLKGAALGGAMMGGPILNRPVLGRQAARAAALASDAALRVGDSALPAARRFLAGAAPVPIGPAPIDLTPIDLAEDRRQGFAAIRAADGPPRIEGLTRWSDWVAVRGALRVRGYRVAAEQRLADSGPGPALFRWTLVRRP